MNDDFIHSENNNAELADRALETYKNESEKSFRSLLNILNGLDAFICVTVLETGEILFLNDNITKYLGIKDGGIGQYCYKLAKNLDTRCDCCPYYQLIKDPHKVVTWEQDEGFGRVHRKTALLIDWPGVGKAHLEYGIDITENLQYETMLKTLNSAAIILLSRSEGTFEKAMTEGLRLIADMTDIDRMSVFRNIDREDTLRISQVYRWDKSAGGTTEIREELRDISYAELAPEWESILAGGDYVNGSIKHMAGEVAWKLFGSVMILAIPIFIDQKFWGFVLFENLRREQSFSEHEVDMLHSASLMAANVVIRYEESVRLHEADERVRLVLESQNNLMHAVNRMSTILLRSNNDTFEKDLLRAMGIMAEATAADRAYIWKNHMRNGVRYSSQIYEWSKTVAPQQKEMSVERRYRDIAPGWGEQLEKGICFKAIVRHMNEAQKALLVPQGVQSILLVPIFLRKRFWGFLGFDDCRRERLFTSNEESILRSASELIADALIRNNMEESIRIATAQLQDALTEAQSANQAKSEFLSRMSHEMRTP
ncbi:MAG: GAF domain-containing protein, partial [Lachnoclostridium sp.]|nr:GAF domain-containing protein [Lachnoclostridium sp.]